MKDLRPKSATTTMRPPSRPTLAISLMALASLIFIAWSDRIPSPLHRSALRPVSSVHRGPPVVGSLDAGGGPEATFGGVLTWHNDNARDGLNDRETILTPASVARGFGLAFSYPLDGYAYAQPLYAPRVRLPGRGLKNLVIVATENESVYAFDADGAESAPLWHANFADSAKGIIPIPARLTGCTDVGPNYGITATPVIDPVSGTVYVVASTYNVKAGKQALTLHALDITTGSELRGSPRDISASYSGVTFNAAFQNSRPGLLFANGEIYVGFAGRCDIQPYNGWVMAYDPTTLRQIAAWNVTPAGTEGGIWQGGGGISADSTGNLFVATANGTFDRNTGGPDFSDSLVKLDPAFNVMGYFTPWNQGALAESDLDIGGGFVLLLPDQAGAHVHEALLGGKEGTLYLTDRDNPGGYNPNNDYQIVQEIPHAFAAGVMGGGAYYNGSVFYGAAGDLLKQFRMSNGTLNPLPLQSSLSPPYPGSTPSISSNRNADGIVWWILDKVPYVDLHATLATNVSVDLYDSGPVNGVHGTKFSTPTIANGRVYVATQTRLLVFGLTRR